MKLANKEHSIFSRLIADRPWSRGGVLALLAAIVGTMCPLERAYAQSADINLGDNAGINPAVGSENNISIGNQQTGSSVDGDRNTAVGWSSGYDVTGSLNIAVGAGAGGNVTGSANIAIGQVAGVGYVGSDNVSVGGMSGTYSEGIRNTNLGTGSGSWSTGNTNVSVGNFAGYQSNGSYNVAIGANAGDSQNSSYSISIGSNAAALVDQSIAIGTNSAVLAGATTGAIALGRNSFVSGAEAGAGAYTNSATPTVGQLAIGGRRITGLADGSAAQDAVTVAQLGAALATVSSSGAINSEAARAQQAEAALGTAVSVLGAEVGALGVSVRANEKSLVAHGAAIAAQTVALADHGASIAEFRSTLSDHAVAMAAERARTMNAEQALRQLVGTMQNSLTEISGQVEALGTFSKETRREARQGVASAMAMVNAPMPSQEGKTAWAFNLATFRGAQASAFSMSHRLATDVPFAISGAMSFGADATAFRIGMAGEF